jgi:hypothetical protein
MILVTTIAFNVVIDDILTLVFHKQRVSEKSINI